MSRAWTPAQQSAITDRGGTLLVSAAAGSGKTTVLVERAVQLMTDEAHPVAADRLLIVTFTRAAAEELRGRLAARLSAELAQHPKSIWLRRQRLLLGRASICTIDAYCMQLLRRHFAEISLPPDFGLADDASVFALRQNTLAAVQEQMYTDADFCAFSSLYGRARSDKTAGDAVLALYDHLRSLPDPQAALSRLCVDYDSAAPLCETAWGRVLLQEAGNAVDAALLTVRRARALIAEEPALAGYDAAFAEDEGFFTTLQGLLCARRWDDALIYNQTYKFSNLRGVRGFDDPLKETVKALRADVKDTQKRMAAKIFICTEAEFAADRARTAPMVHALARAVTLFEEQFFAAKLAEKVLEYSDFEHLALNLLCDADGVRTPLSHAIAAGFDAVMVDEYQDTNALQALLYKCLANEDESNLFFVGDVKQSIYRFRLANPESFIEKRESFARYETGQHPATVVLGHNFRSAQNVIDQINDVFGALMSRDVGDVAYDDDEKLYAGAPGEYDGGPLALRIVHTTPETKPLGDAPAGAQQIAEMVRAGFLVRGKEGLRPCQYDDFCILLRSRANFSLYEAELARLGVQAYADTGESWLTSPEVSPLLSLLRVIDNPGQDVHMAAALLSVMFGYTPDDLVRLRLLAPGKTLYSALLDSTLPADAAFCATLQKLRALAASAPVERVCTEIFARTHYFAAVGAMENGVAARENLRSFTAFAAACCAAGRSGLAGFLRYVDDMTDSRAPLGAAAPQPPQGSVSIMTIHRSKGLEFPVCILADAAREFNLRDLTGHILFHPRLGLGIDLRGEGGIYPTAATAALRAALRREALSEEMRILYVALTRARDKLIVTFPTDRLDSLLSGLATGVAGAGGTPPFLLGGLRSYAAWLTAAALTHPDGAVLRRAAGAATLPLRKVHSALDAAILSSEAAAQEALPPAFERKAKPDAQLYAALLHNFSRTAPMAPLSALPAKLSVSALSHKDAQPVLARPAFLYKEGLTAAERGTAQHAFLQFADFSAAVQDLPAEIERLVSEEYLDAVTAQKLPLARIEAFLHSDVCARMRSADRVLREYDFITAVPARFVADIDPAFAYQPVLVQGIADAVLLRGDTAEIVDYKTDRGKTPQQFLAAYTKQLLLYKAAVEKRLGVRVTACTIYAFEPALEISVPLEKA